MFINAKVKTLLCAALLLASARPLHAADALFDTLVEKKGAPARELLIKPTLYRETALTGLPCSAGDFEFLLDRPRSSVALAGKVHKSLDKYEIDIPRPGVFHIDDRGKLVGDMELVASGPGVRLYYVTGYWKLLRGVTLSGRMALVVEYQEKSVGSAHTLDVKVRGYMMVDSSVAGAAFKVLAYMFPKKVDARIDRFAAAVRKVVVAIHDDPEGATKRLDAARHVPPGEVNEFRARFTGGTSR